MPRPTLATEPAPADLQAERHERAVLACVCACTVLVVGFVAAINLAVPRLAASALHPTSTELLWVVDSYVVLFACLVVPAGALGDRVGRKGVLLAGLAGLAVGAAVCAAAGDVAVLLVGRAVTGIGAACVLPNALAVLVHATEPARRPRAVATWAGMSGIGGLVGNVAGGAILTAGSWRWLFACVTPVALACTVWVAAATRPSSRQARSLDPLGAGLLTGATLAVLLGIVQSPADGWGSATVIGALAVGGVLLAAGSSSSCGARSRCSTRGCSPGPVSARPASACSSCSSACSRCSSSTRRRCSTCAGSPCCRQGSASSP